LETNKLGNIKKSNSRKKSAGKIRCVPRRVAVKAAGCGEAENRISAGSARMESCVLLLQTVILFTVSVKLKKQWHKDTCFLKIIAG
jgi:hypothetical protein